MNYERLDQYENDALFKELSANLKASFDPMFGMNARKAYNRVADVLFSRGITHQPNIFGDIEIRKFE